MVWEDSLFQGTQKAFDTVPRRLMTRLSTHAYVSDELQKWIYSYLTGREQRTHVRGAFIVPIEGNKWRPSRLTAGIITVNDPCHCCAIRYIIATEHVYL